MISDCKETLAINEGVSFHFILSLDSVPYAEIRVDAFPAFAHVHARMYKVNKHTLKEIKKDMELAVRPVLEEFEYPCFYVVTPHEKLLKHMTRLPYEHVGVHESMNVFRIMV